MSGQSKFTRTLVAITAALVMSSVTVGAAVGPAQAGATPIAVSANA
jgi:heme/copper-type cytochrome/quinol oxidase subunit 3